MIAADPMPTVDERLTPLERTIELADMVAYAGATWDWHRMHYDADYVAAKGFEAPVVDGQVFGALLVEQLQDALGPTARVREQSFRFRSMVYADERIRCEATVTAVDGDRLEVDQRVVVIDVAGNEDRVAVTGDAVVEVGR